MSTKQYTSNRVYTGKRPVSAERLALLRANYARTHGGAPRPLVGFFDALTPEQQKLALEYQGPENLGDEDLSR